MIPANVAAAAIRDKYNDLDFTPKPEAFLDVIPAVNNTTPPNYIIITQTAEQAEYMVGLDRIETAIVKLELFGPDKVNLQAVASGIMYDGDPVAQRSGLDDASGLPNLPSGYSLNKCERINSGLMLEEKQHSPSASTAFRGELNYRVELFFDASA